MQAEYAAYDRHAQILLNLAKPATLSKFIEDGGMSLSVQAFKHGFLSAEHMKEMFLKPQQTEILQTLANEGLAAIILGPLKHMSNIVPDNLLLLDCISYFAAEEIVKLGGVATLLEVVRRTNISAIAVHIACKVLWMVSMRNRSRKAC